MKDFADENGLQKVDEAEIFEHFVNYCIISREHPDAFEFERIRVGGSGDLGIDGLAILVNEHLVASREDVDFFKSNLRRLDVQFIFIQAKTSSSFDGGALGTFLYGVRSFFSAGVLESANAALRELHELKEYIYDSSLDMDRSPVCHLYYVTTGRWQNDKNITSRVADEVKILEGFNLFSRVEFTPVDAEGLKQIFRQIKHKIVKEFSFEKHTILPAIKHVQEAYIGIVPCKEYLKLISNDDGTLNRRLFYDNVRDYQGHNPVNSEIESTIANTECQDRFALLNNGVTIVAKDVHKIGVNFRLKDFQIVNGCQTSHVLFHHRDMLPSAAFLPIKLIVTDDVEVTNQIIQGTNRQTEVKLEAFESLAPFQKRLEEFYLALSRETPSKLYYERRSKQYEASPIKREQIITLGAQVQCFLAMFLNEPHSTHRYYGELLKANRNRLFLDSHSPSPYFASAYALHTLEGLFAAGMFDRRLKPFRHQMIMLFRLLAEPGDMPYLNARGIDRYCSDLLEALSNGDVVLRHFQVAGTLVEETLDRVKVDAHEATRLRAFTAALLEAALHQGATSAAKVHRESGTVKWFSSVKGYGFLVSTAGEEIFVHYSDIRGTGYKALQPEDRVEFSIVERDGKTRAVEVERA